MKVRPRPGAVARFRISRPNVVCTDVKSHIIRLDASFNEAEIIQQRKREFCSNCGARFEEIPDESTLRNCSTFHTAPHIPRSSHPRSAYLGVLQGRGAAYTLASY